MRSRRKLFGGLAPALAAVLMIAVAIPVTVVSSYLPAAVTGHRAEWIALLAGAALVIAALTWLSGRSATQASDGRLFLLPPVPGWIDRAELAEVETALTSRGSRTVALTTGLVGAGGFGKTMLAARGARAAACSDGSGAGSSGSRSGEMWTRRGWPPG